MLVLTVTAAFGRCWVGGGCSWVVVFVCLAVANAADVDGRQVGIQT